MQTVLEGSRGGSNQRLAWSVCAALPNQILVARASRAFSHTSSVRLQELYQAVPVALAPVLGNPLALAAFGLDRSASLPDQARTPQLVLPNHSEHSGMFKHPDFASRREEDGCLATWCKFDVGGLMVSCTGHREYSEVILIPRGCLFNKASGTKPWLLLHAGSSAGAGAGEPLAAAGRAFRHPAAAHAGLEAAAP